MLYPLCLLYNIVFFVWSEHFIFNFIWPYFPPLAPARWRCWPGQPGSHTKLWGGLAHRLPPAEQDDWWLFPHSPKRHLPVPKRGRRRLRTQWCRSEREEGRSGGVAGLGPWHSRSHLLHSEGGHWCTVDDIHQTHPTCEVVRAARPPYCVRPGMPASVRPSNSANARGADVFLLTSIYPGLVPTLQVQFVL